MRASERKDRSLCERRDSEHDALVEDIIQLRNIIVHQAFTAKQLHEARPRELMDNIQMLAVCHNVSLERPVLRHKLSKYDPPRTNSIVGWLDLKLGAWWQASADGTMLREGFLGIIAIEAKPTIESVGDVIRQMNYYRYFDSEPIYMVACPDDRWRRRIESQGIWFGHITAQDDTVGFNGTVIERKTENR